MWGYDPPSQITNPSITLEEVLNLACAVKISDNEALVVGRPSGNNDHSFSWIFNLPANTWRRVGDTVGRRDLTACAYIENTVGKYVISAGGFDGRNPLSTTERFDLATEQWTILSGVTLNKPIAQGSMVSIDSNKEVLFIGGYDGSNYLTEIWRVDDDMNSWTFAGNLKTARGNAVSLLAPPSILPPLCDTTN